MATRSRIILKGEFPGIPPTKVSRGRSREQYKESLSTYIRSLAETYYERECNSEDTYGIQIVFNSDRRRIDIDNLLKTVLDAITWAEVWPDDSKVHEVVARINKGRNLQFGIKFIVYYLENEIPTEVQASKPSKPIKYGKCLRCGNELLKKSSSERKYRERKYCEECRKIILRQSALEHMIFG